MKWESRSVMRWLLSAFRGHTRGYALQACPHHGAASRLTPFLSLPSALPILLPLSYSQLSGEPSDYPIAEQMHMLLRKRDNIEETLEN